MNLSGAPRSVTNSARCCSSRTKIEPPTTRSSEECSRGRRTRFCSRCPIIDSFMEVMPVVIMMVPVVMMQVSALYDETYNVARLKSQRLQQQVSASASAPEPTTPPGGLSPALSRSGSNGSDKNNGGSSSNDNGSDDNNVGGGDGSVACVWSIAGDLVLHIKGLAMQAESSL